MTQLRPDAAYIRTEPHERTSDADGAELTDFDEQVCQLLSTAHTVRSAAKSMSRPSEILPDEWENRIAQSMGRLLQAERIQLSPDS